MANQSPAPKAPHGRQSGPGKKLRPLPPTKFQQHKEAVNRWQENADKAQLNGRVWFDAERLARISPTILRQLEWNSSESTNEADDNQPIAYGRPAYPDQQDPNDESNESGEQGQLAQETQSSDDEPTTTGGQLANRAKKIMGEGGEKAKEALKNEVKKKAVELAKKKAVELAAKALARLALMNPYVLTALAIIGGVLILIILVFVLIMAIAGGGDVSGSGTSSTVSYSRKVDTSALESLLKGDISTTDDAQKVLNEVSRLKTEFNANQTALAILQKIEGAAQAIISDPATATEQAKIIRENFKKLDLLNANDIRDCAGVKCLDVEPIGEEQKSHCGRAAVLMVIRFINKGVSNPRYEDEGQIIERNGVLLNNPSLATCVSPAAMNRLSPDDRKGWAKHHYGEVKGEDQKNFVLQAIQNSLIGGDPVVLYLNPGATLSNSQHIVTVIGYDPNDEPEELGTYIINNPNVGSVTARTKYGDSTRNKKLTGEWIKQFMGGGNRGPYPEGSVMIREKYWK